MTVKIVAGVAYGFTHMFERECFAFGIVDFSKSPSVLDLIISWVAECANLVTPYYVRAVTFVADDELLIATLQHLDLFCLPVI